MLQLLENGCFLFEACQGNLVGPQGGSHHLDGGVLAGFRVTAEIDRAHGAAAEFFLDHKRPDLLTHEHGNVSKSWGRAPRFGAILRRAQASEGFLFQEGLK